MNGGPSIPSRLRRRPMCNLFDDIYSPQVTAYRFHATLGFPVIYRASRLFEGTSPPSSPTFARCDAFCGANHRERREICGEQICLATFAVAYLHPCTSNDSSRKRFWTCAFFCGLRECETSAEIAGFTSSAWDHLVRENCCYFVALKVARFCVVARVLINEGAKRWKYDPVFRACFWGMWMGGLLSALRSGLNIFTEKYTYIGLRMLS